MGKLFSFRHGMLLLLFGMAAHGQAATQTLDAAYSGAYWKYETG